MKLIIYIFSYSLIFFIFGCTKLNTNPYDSTTEKSIFSSVEGMEASILGCYDAMQSFEYYGRNFFILQEIYSDNAKLSSLNTGQFSDLYSLQVSNGNKTIESIWKTGYSIISHCNSILSSIDSVKNITPIQTRKITGEALAIRSLIYFDLIRLFAQTYTFSNTAIEENADSEGGHTGIPLILNKTNIQDLSAPDTKSVNEIYTQIISDLTRADSLLSHSTFSPHRLNTYSIHALLSQIFLTQKKYDIALNYCESVIESQQFSLVDRNSFLNNWNSDNSSEIVFSISMTATDYPGTNSLAHILSPEGYGAIVPSEDLTNTYSSSDIRLEFFQKRTETFCNKYNGTNNILGVHNIPIIRISEMYMIQAECYAQKALKTSGFTPFAQEALLTIAQRSDSTIFAINSTGTDLLEDIYTEYRKEFAFEGRRFFQLKRLESSIVRSDCNNNCNLSYPDTKFAFPFPLHETLIQSLTE
ncbi:MAG: RagB/SusD family nutrient uptake outer membrane protein [Bacteroidota bacterium]